MYEWAGLFESNYNITQFGHKTFKTGNILRQTFYLKYVTDYKRVALRLKKKYFKDEESFFDLDNGLEGFFMDLESR